VNYGSNNRNLRDLTGSPSLNENSTAMSRGLRFTNFERRVDKLVISTRGAGSCEWMIAVFEPRFSSECGQVHDARRAADLVDTLCQALGSTRLFGRRHPSAWLSNHTPRDTPDTPALECDPMRQHAPSESAKATEEQGFCGFMRQSASGIWLPE